MTTSKWNEIRQSLRTDEPEELRRAAVRVGKIKAEDLPNDIGSAVIGLFGHLDPEIRAEAIRAVGLHWRLESAVKPIVDLLEHEDDWYVRIASISALGSLGLDHARSRCLVSRTLARVVLNDRFADNERMISCLELLRVEGKISPREYMVRDKQLPERLSEFEVDQSCVDDVAKQDCSGF